MCTIYLTLYIIFDIPIRVLYMFAYEYTYTLDIKQVFLDTVQLHISRRVPLITLKKIYPILKAYNKCSLQITIDKIHNVNGVRIIFFTDISKSTI